MMASLATPFPCPSCQTPLVFRTEVSLAQVCPSCLSVVRKTMVPGAVPQKAVPMREVMSIIQIGMTGTRAGDKFEVIGRIQYFFLEGYRNHWFVLYESGLTGWLGDWAGNYCFFQESSYTGHSPVGSLCIGDTATIGAVILSIEVKDKVKQIFWEGEVPEQGLQELGFASIELFRTDGQMGILQVTNSRVPHAYLGSYVELNEMSLQGTRTHDEWL